jgi:hypothetical protein
MHYTIDGNFLNNIETFADTTNVINEQTQINNTNIGTDYIRYEYPHIYPSDVKYMNNYIDNYKKSLSIGISELSDLITKFVNYNLNLDDFIEKESSSIRTFIDNNLNSTNLLNLIKILENINNYENSIVKKNELANIVIDLQQKIQQQQEQIQKQQEQIQQQQEQIQQIKR